MALPRFYSRHRHGEHDWRPHCELGRLAHELGCECIEVDPADIARFSGVGHDITFAATDHDMVELMLAKPVVEFSSVHKCRDFTQIDCIAPELFAHAPELRLCHADDRTALFPLRGGEAAQWVFTPETAS